MSSDVLGLTGLSLLVMASAMLAQSLEEPPFIIEQPQSAMIRWGASHLLKCTAQEPPEAWQWYKDGNILPWATNSTISISGTNAAEIGEYSIVLMNSAGATTSQVARVVLEGVDSRLWQGLVAWYPFDDSIAEDGTGYDQSVFHGDLVYEGTVVLVDDERGRTTKGLDLIGDEPFLECNSPAIPSGNAPRTIFVWLKKTRHWVTDNGGVGWGAILSYKGEWQQQPWLEALDDSRGQATRWIGDVQATPDSFVHFASDWTEGEWRHVVVTYSSPEIRAYVDGQLVKSKTISTFARESSTDLYIGFPGYAFPGVVDDIRIYSRALPPDEVALLHAHESTGCGQMDAPVLEPVINFCERGFGA